MSRTRSPRPLHRRPSVLLCTGVAVVGMIVVMTARAGDPPDDPTGSGPGDPAAAVGPSTLAAALAATRAPASARVELATTVPGPAGPVTLVHRAAYADGGLRAEASTDMSQVAAALAAAGQPLDGDWSRPSGVVVDGDTVYAQLGPMAPELGRDPSDWTRARLADAAGDADNDTLALALDPLGPLDLLRHPVLEIGEVGAGDAAADEVRGTPCRHVRARLDITGAGGDDRAGDRSGSNGSGGGPAGNGSGGGPGDGSGTGGAPASFEARLLAAGFESLPIDVWLGADGTVRRLVLTVEGAEVLTTTFDVYDLGADVTVEVPDSADVIDPPQE